MRHHPAFQATLKDSPRLTKQSPPVTVFGHSLWQGAGGGSEGCLTYSEGENSFLGGGRTLQASDPEVPNRLTRAQPLRKDSSIAAAAPFDPAGCNKSLSKPRPLSSKWERGHISLLDTEPNSLKACGDLTLNLRVRARVADCISFALSEILKQTSCGRSIVSLKSMATDPEMIFAAKTNGLSPPFQLAVSARL